MGDVEAIVFDIGSYKVHAGFAGDDSPRVNIPSVVGRPKYPNYMLGRYRDTFIGDQAQARRGILKMKYPIENGIVTDWDDYERVLHHVFYNELRVSPEEHPILLTKPVLNPKANAEKCKQIIFETFNNPAMYIAFDTVLSLYSSGRTSGLSVSCGEGVTSVLPLYEGFGIPYAVKRMDIAGDVVNKVFKRQLTENGNGFTYSNDYEIVRDIKNKTCYVALDYEKETHNFQINSGYTEYELPDNQKIQVGGERFRAPEVLFNPSLEGYELPGIHQLAYESILQSPLDTRSDLLKNIVVTGGSTMIPGFADRLYKEIKNLASPSSTVKVIASPERNNSVWIGGSILASLGSFQQMWISKEEYDECGPSIRIRKVF